MHAPPDEVLISYIIARCYEPTFREQLLKALGQARLLADSRAPIESQIEHIIDKMRNRAPLRALVYERLRKEKLLLSSDQTYAKVNETRTALVALNDKMTSWFGRPIVQKAIDLCDMLVDPPPAPSMKNEVRARQLYHASSEGTATHSVEWEDLPFAKREEWRRTAFEQGATEA